MTHDNPPLTAKEQQRLAHIWDMADACMSELNAEDDIAFLLCLVRKLELRIIEQCNGFDPALTAEQVAHNILVDFAEKFFDKDSIAVQIRAYAAQQTAAKDARIAELEKDGTYKDTCDFLNNLCRQLVTERDAAIKEVGNSAQERDALQAQLDVANAQVAMVQLFIDVISGKTSVRDVTIINNAEDEAIRIAHEYRKGISPVSVFEITDRMNKLYFNSLEFGGIKTQPTTEQWLADRDAALLKPWREAVRVLREKLEYIGCAGPECLGPDDEYCARCCALKATEGLV